MKIIIEDKEYTIRHNHLHRGQNPRLVLNFKDGGRFVFLQFNNMYFDLKNVEIDKTYNAWWCSKKGTSDITLKFSK